MSTRSRLALKILVGFGLAVAIAVLMGVIARFNTAAISRQLDFVTNQAYPSALAVEQVERGLMTATRGANGTLAERIASDAEMGPSLARMINDGMAAVVEGRDALEPMMKGRGDASAWSEVRTPLDAWSGRMHAYFDRARERDGLRKAGASPTSAEVLRADDRAWAAYQEVRRSYVAVAKPLAALREAIQREVATAKTSARADAERGDLVILAALLLATAAMIAIGAFLGRRVALTVRALLSETGRIRDAVAAGRLEFRGDPGVLDPEFQPIIEGMNATMDAYGTPIALTAEYVTRIGNGDIPPPITARYEGDFNRIKDALNRCIGNVQALVADAAALAQAGVEGKLATRADAARHQGEFRKIVQGVNDTLDAVVGPLTVAARTVDSIARGAIPPRIAEEYRGDFDVLKRNLNTCIDAVNAVVHDANVLADAAVQGRLATRVDASRHQGDFRKIVDGVNSTLDAVIGPLEVAAGCVEKISRGEIPPKITQSYAGDFSKVRDNLNTCIEAVNRLAADANALVDASVAGRLSTRADASRHQGDFRKIVDGVNRTLDAVIAPVNEAASVLVRLASRDLRARMSGEYQGDHARIKDALNGTAQALHDAIGQVAEAVDQVSSAASQIATSSQAVASGASEQASALEETSTTLESLASGSSHTSSSAQQANALVVSARTAASDGAAAVEQLQAAMGSIRQSAENTSQIIKDVSDIAFQTNLLALNAAVEAARAGEVGRGFAVVAEEVRSLALRAKDAARKTEELIRRSVAQAGEGETAARQVAAKLDDISQGVGKVSDLVGEIAAAAKEQDGGVLQVNGAITEMDKVTQQNAASAEESSSAASELSGQAEELAAMVGAFRIERAGAAGHASPVRRTRRREL